MKKATTSMIALILVACGCLHGQGFNTTIGKSTKTAFINGPLQVTCGNLVTYSFSMGPLVHDYCSSIKWTVSDTNGRYERYSGGDIEIAVSSTQAEMIISVSAESCNSGDKYVATESVTIGTVVSSPITLNGSRFLCNAASSSYTTSAVSGADNYIFSVPTGWKINGVSRTSYTTSSRTVSITAPSSGSGTAQIGVRANKIDACGSTSSSLRSKTINYGRQFPVISPRNVTVGANSFLTFAANGENLSNIRWIIPNGWNANSGLNGAELQVITSGPPGNYFVEVAAQSCGANVGDYINVTIDNGPAGFFIMNQGHNGIINSKNENTIEPAENITVYPNPSNHRLWLKKSDNSPKITSISMVNISNGKQVLTQRVNDNNSIDLRHVNEGTYIVNITTQNGERIQKKIEVVH